MEAINPLPPNYMDVEARERFKNSDEQAQANNGVSSNRKSEAAAIDVVNNQLLTGEADIDAVTIELRYNAPMLGIDIQA